MKLSEHLVELNRELKRQWLWQLACLSLSILILALLWSSIFYALIWESLHLSICFGGLLSLIIHSHKLSLFTLKRIKATDLMLSLDIKHQNSQSAFDLLTQSPNAFWQQKIFEHKNNLIKAKKLRLKSSVIFAVVSATLCILFLFFVPKFRWFSQDLYSDLSLKYTSSTEIIVIKGSKNPDDQQRYILQTFKAPRIDLYKDNILKLSLKGNHDQSLTRKQRRPVVILKKTNFYMIDAKVFQSFMFNPDGGDNSVEFSVGESVALFVDAISVSKPLAILKVIQPPIPEVDLRLNAVVKDDWHDDKPLPFLIKAKSHHPLDSIKLKILIGKKQQEEMVSKFVNQKITKFSQNYDLLLEPYLEEDVSDVEIYAEAIDRAEERHIGRSKSIIIKTSSAYGRYKRTLSYLLDLKKQVDLAIPNKEALLEPKSLELIRMAEEQALISPFFDNIDRYDIAEINTLTEYATEDKTAKYSLIEKLGEFLFDHEMLDDRERDRDFFVAINHFTRQLNDPKSKPESIQHSSEQILKFLNERDVRWSVRTNRLGQSTPEMWGKVKDGYFAKQLSLVLNYSRLGQKQEALKKLLSTNSQYETWIKTLEAAEDKFAEEQKRSQQSGIANAQNKLRELQKVQDEISKTLDQAANNKNDKLKSDWLVLKLKQQSNLEDTQKLNEQIQLMAPSAGNRLSLAAEAMEETIRGGQDGDFVRAESASDIASRLLRQAERSASQQQQKNKQDRGRRRRVENDQYYGKSVAPGDIKVRYEYQVDERYREDILNQLESSELNPEDKPLVEDYIKKIIR